MRNILCLILFFLPFPIINFIFAKIPSETGKITLIFVVILITSLLISKYFVLNSKYLILFRRLMILFMVFYSVYLFAMSIARYYNFRSEIIDLSYYDHVVLQLSKFQIPKVWDNDWFVWGDHFDAILFFFAPLYWIKREPAILMAIQSGLALLAGIPIYLLCREKLRKHTQNYKLISLAVSFSYLLFGAHQMGYLYGFHEIVMLPFFFFWMLLFLEKKSWKLFLLFLFLTTIIKEDTFFVLLFLGLYLLLTSSPLKLLKHPLSNLKYYKIPLLFIGVGIAWYLFTFKLIFTHFYPYWNFHTGLYDGLKSIDGIKNLLQPYKIGTIVNHLGAFSFLPLLYPPSLIVTIPAWLQKLLTNDIASLSGFHYSSAITTLIVFASIEALSHYKNIKHRSSLFIAVVLVAFYANFFLGYQPSSLANVSLKEFSATPNQQTAYNFMKHIPDNASVSASYILVPHLKKPTGKIFAVPRNNDTSEYILLDHNISIPLTTISVYKQYLISLEKNYEIINSSDNVFLLKRKRP